MTDTQVGWLIGIRCPSFVEFHTPPHSTTCSEQQTTVIMRGAHSSLSYHIDAYGFFRIGKAHHTPGHAFQVLVELGALPWLQRLQISCVGR